MIDPSLRDLYLEVKEAILLTREMRDDRLARIRSGL
jgi:hypothetical protein